MKSNVRGRFCETNNQPELNAISSTFCFFQALVYAAGRPGAVMVFSA